MFKKIGQKCLILAYDNKPSQPSIILEGIFESEKLYPKNLILS